MRSLFSRQIAKLCKRCHSRIGKAVEALRSDRLRSGPRLTRLQMLRLLACMLWIQLHERLHSAPPAVARPRETSPSPQAVMTDAPCRNNAVTKAAEVHTTLISCSAEGTPLRAGLDELHRRGAFRHGHDVAYAAIFLTREWSTIDELVVELARDYARIAHRCDPVYPPS